MSSSPSNNGQQFQPIVLGGVPTVKVDVPICAVFIFLFLLGSLGHTFVFCRNIKSHRFIWSLFIAFFCITRIAACSLRIVETFYPHNQALAIATQVLIDAGVLFIYAVNNIFAMRLLHRLGALIGTNVVFEVLHIASLVALIPVMAMLVTSTALLRLNPRPENAQEEHIALRVGTMYAACIAAAPLILLIVVVDVLGSAKAYLVYSKNKDMKMMMDLRRWSGLSFKDETHATKAAWVLFFGVALSIVEAGFRAGTLWLPSTELNQPRWFESRTAFYCFFLAPEILIVVLYLAARVDNRFYTPSKHERKKRRIGPPREIIY